MVVTFRKPPPAPPSESSEDYEVPLCHGSRGSETSSSLIYDEQCKYIDSGVTRRLIKVFRFGEIDNSAIGVVIVLGVQPTSCARAEGVFSDWVPLCGHLSPELAISYRFHPGGSVLELTTRPEHTSPHRFVLTVRTFSGPLNTLVKPPYHLVLRQSQIYNDSESSSPEWDPLLSSDSQYASLYSTRLRTKYFHSLATHNAFDTLLHSARSV
ncbi:hypothetical protein BIW11_03097 [Tropilaelaps mercedesae]|uniref:Uncharacterized protein n=1 Tax=Tropilaelaps mercedesae TaxID=418985 RepID=A0A1V9XSG8_9ACAR|nr:hypothetical protein BIW11_03097 [Tropilaelaps mercedesae]